ncbi:MAG: peptide chain release factor 2 [Planctomycetes bacterium HGW-Planctomycetes-1]|nr:MAG: peptide chain release factor 2 [Planctomycetes bacterium HGW-Planctomycetes-1]
MELAQLKQRINDLRARITKIRDGFDLPGKLAERQKLQEQMSRQGFWDNQDSAKKVVSKLSALKAVVEPAIDAEREITDLAELFEVALAENDAQIIADSEQELIRLEKDCVRIELTGMLSGPDDTKNCFFSIHAGAGGTESCDWVSMLLRMYTRFFQQNKFTYEELDMTPGEEAGLRSVTLKVSGPFAFGKLSCEAGVHRLVRISPFDANKRRHTSFAAVDCLPEYDEDIDIEIDEKDLRIDFYRAGGAGGQHVNKTSSAVRITHAPTGIVTQCQSDRSQHRNKAEAMKMLKAKLYMLEQQKRDAEVAKLYGAKGEIAWGNQIRSYVLQPYQLVKDHRTDCQTGKVDAVLDGDIEEFIDSYLQYRAEKKHKQSPER